MPRPHAFSLIEVLIVVGIVAILAAIAVPNFLESQTRAKVTRARSDQRAMAVAIEAYRVDANVYPPCAEDFRGDVGLSHVTTPVAYIVSENVKEIFPGKTVASNLSPFYGYAARDQVNFATQASQRIPHWWLLVSNGPDLLADDFATPLQGDDLVAFVNTVYDPTNGIVSGGNIYRVGGNIGGPGSQAAHWIGPGGEPK